MPNPIIIFNPYVDQSAYRFLIENAAALKAMGYHKFLLEMDNSVTTAQFKRLIDIIRLSVPDSPQAKALLLMNKVIDALEANNIICQFIDPQSQVDAVSMTQNVRLAATDADKALAVAERECITDLRDKDMASTILQKSMLFEGGIIFLGGFAHRYLAKYLQNQKEHNIRYVLFMNSAEDPTIRASTPPEDYLIWKQLAQVDYRKKYYFGADVQYIDYKKPLSFEMLEAICGLSDRKPYPDRPALAIDFDEMTQHHHDYFLDEWGVLTASTPIQNEEDFQEEAAIIQKKFPGLFFYKKQENEQACLEIPGLNLPENAPILKAGLCESAKTEASKNQLRRL